MIKNNRGFTLIEIIVVIVLLGLIITLTITNNFRASDSVKNKLDQIAINNLKEATIIYAKDNNLRDCGNCVDYSLNMECVSSNTQNNEKTACRNKNKLTVSLAYLKTNNYFQDASDKCYKLDANKNKINPNDIIITIYRYNTDYFVEIDNVFCAK